MLVVKRMESTQVQELNFEQVQEGLNKGSLIYLDVRNRDELERDGKVVGSVNIPLPELEEAFGKGNVNFLVQYSFPKPDITANNIVVACRTGGRAGKAIATLQRLGYTSIMLYKGFLDWEAKGGSISKPNTKKA